MSSMQIELAPEGEARVRAALEGLRKFNPSLTLEGLMLAIFCYGLDKVELELAVSNLEHDKQGRIIVPTS
jgi:hypothetical protein